MKAELLKTIFETNNVDFHNITVPASGNDPILKKVMRSQIESSLLTCGNEYFVALNSARNKFDLNRLSKVVGKKLRQANKAEQTDLSINLLASQFKNKNDVHIFIDEALESQDEVYFVDQALEHIYAIGTEQLHKLSSDNLIGISFSEKNKDNMDKKETLSFKDRVKALHTLPPMPETASKILGLRAISDVKVEQIVEVIEKDPVLVAQIVSYANSAFFGQAGSVKSLKDAIFRVLGVDAVMNMALALSVGSTFKIPLEGPVGAKAVWKSSIYAASLMQRLSMLMPWGERPNPGTAYLIGLLHDIGLLVLGHLFNEEYIELNHYLEQNPDVGIFEAEQTVLGITHIEVGKMVMRMWKMPEELIATAIILDEKSTSNDHENYIQLLCVIKTLLIPHGLAFGNAQAELQPDLLNALNLEEEEVIIAVDEVLSEGDIIKNLVKQMCA